MTGRVSSCRMDAEDLPCPSCAQHLAVAAGRVAVCGCGKWFVGGRILSQRAILRRTSFDAVLRRTSAKYKIELRAMGYRRVGDHPREKAPVWAKPIAHTLLTISLLREGARFEQWFRGANGKHLVYSSSTKTDHNQSMLDWLKFAECYTARLNLDPGSESSFEFLNRDDESQWLCNLL